MGYKVEVLPSANQDVRDISRYLLGHGRQTATNFADAYQRQLDLLASGTVSYALSRLPELAAQGFHACHVNSYIMLYYVDDDTIVIAHLFHQSRDYGKLI